MSKLKRLRTIKQMLAEIKKEDPNSCVTKYMLQHIITINNISYIEAGNKHLYDFDLVLSKLGLV